MNFSSPLFFILLITTLVISIDTSIFAEEIKEKYWCNDGVDKLPCELTNKEFNLPFFLYVFWPVILGVIGAIISVIIIVKLRRKRNETK